MKRGDSSSHPNLRRGKHRSSEMAAKRAVTEDGVTDSPADWDKIFDAITDLVSVHDTRFRIVRVNKAFSDFVGQPASELIGKFCYEMVHATRRPPGSCPLAEAVRTRATVTEEIHDVVRDVHWLITCSPIFDEHGDFTSAVHIIRDITERKRAEERVQRQLENMTALRDIGVAIGGTLDLRVTLSILIEKLIEQLGADAADVLLLEPNELFLTYSAGRGFKTHAIKNTRVRMGKGHVGRVAFERQTLIVGNLAETLTHALRGESFEAYIAMPLIAQGKLKGVLETFHRKPFHPTPEWMNFLELLSAQAAIAIDNATLFDSLQRLNSELVISYEATLEGWGRTLELRDIETKGHTERVAGMTVSLARAMGLPEQDLVHIRRGALLHDIGKIGIPDRILLKRGPLTEEESEIMRRHPIYAHELLSAIPFLRPAIDIPYCHHERWAGDGYPRGLKGKRIPLYARIFTVVDVVDALTSDRPYRAAWPMEKTRQHVKSLAGIQFDPAVVDEFMTLSSK